MKAAVWGNIYGKSNKANAPTLTIRTLYDPSVAIEDINENATENTMHDLSGRRVDSSTAKQGIYIVGRKKIVIGEGK